MKSTSNHSETGHGKNVANFKDLIGACKGYGPKYRPANQRLSIPALETQAAAADEALQAVSAADKHLTSVIALRAAAFKGIKPFSTRILGALESADDVPDGILEAARSINRRIQGQAAPGTLSKDRKAQKAAAVAIAAGAPESEIPEANTGKRSHQSYFSISEFLGEWHTLLGEIGAYQPAEEDLQHASIGSAVQNLRTANDAVRDAARDFHNAMINRDRLLYDKPTGLLETAAKVKKYIKSVFKSNAPEFGGIKGITFRKAKK